MNIYVYSSIVALCVISVALFLSIRTVGANSHSLIFKTFASLMFVIIGALSIISGANPKVKILFVLGLVFGLVGDILLDLKVMHPDSESTYLNSGMMMFGCGHVLYFLGIIIFVADKDVTGFGWVLLSGLVFSLIVGALIVKFAPNLKMNFTGYKIQNWLYSSVLIFMTIISVALAVVLPATIPLAVGFVLFLASDLVLSMQYFGGKQSSNGLTIANHVLYYVAQILIASFVWFI